MTTAAQARKLLKGHWKNAMLVECLGLMMWLVLVVFQLAVLRLTGMGAEQLVTLSHLLNNGAWYALLTVGAMVMDWLLLSPFYLGRINYYISVAKGYETPISKALIFYGRGYLSSLRWRLSQSLRRLLCTVVCMLPAAAAGGFIDALRWSEAYTPMADIAILVCTVSLLILIPAGVIAVQFLMLRWLPSGFLLVMNRHEKYPRKLFRNSSRVMHTHNTAMFRLYFGFSGWIFTCVLLIPCFFVFPMFFIARARKVCKHITCYNKNCAKEKTHDILLSDTRVLPSLPVNIKSNEKQPSS